jgi:hypothetical protein
MIDQIFGERPIDIKQERPALIASPAALVIFKTSCGQSRRVARP